MDRRAMLAALAGVGVSGATLTPQKITRFVTHKATIARREFLFLEVHTDSGLVGLGEGSLPSRVSIVEEAVKWLEPKFVGQDPAGMEDHWDRIYYRTNRWRHGSVLMTAQSAVDIALWDLEAKRLGVSVARLLGGPIHKHIRVYYSHWDSPVKPRSPEVLARRAVETVERGWTGVKLIPELGSTEAETISKTVAELEAIRKAVGMKLDIGLELVERFTTRSAIEFSKAVAPYRPMFIEEATIRENPGAMTELKQKSPVPVATGEGLLSRFDYRHLLDANGAAIIQPDVIHCGGITEMRKIANLAEVYGVDLSPHQWYGPVAHVASLAAASVCRNLFIHEWDGGNQAVFQELTKGSFPVQKDGRVKVPNDPGLGIEMDFREVARRFPFIPV